MGEMIVPAIASKNPTYHTLLEQFVTEDFAHHRKGGGTLPSDKVFLAAAHLQEALVHQFVGFGIADDRHDLHHELQREWGKLENGCAG